MHLSSFIFSCSGRIKAISIVLESSLRALSIVISCNAKYRSLCQSTQLNRPLEFENSNDELAPNSNRLAKYPFFQKERVIIINNATTIRIVISSSINYHNNHSSASLRSPSPNALLFKKAAPFMTKLLQYVLLHPKRH